MLRASVWLACATWVFAFFGPSTYCSTAIKVRLSLSRGRSRPPPLEPRVAPPAFGTANTQGRQSPAIPRLKLPSLLGSLPVLPPSYPLQRQASAGVPELLQQATDMCRLHGDIKTIVLKKAGSRSGLKADRDPSRPFGLTLKLATSTSWGPGTSACTDATLTEPTLRIENRTQQHLAEARGFVRPPDSSERVAIPIPSNLGVVVPGDTPTTVVDSSAGSPHLTLFRWNEVRGVAEIDGWLRTAITGLENTIILATASSAGARASFLHQSYHTALDELRRAKALLASGAVTGDTNLDLLSQVSSAREELPLDEHEPTESEESDPTTQSEGLAFAMRRKRTRSEVAPQARTADPVQVRKKRKHSPSRPPRSVGVRWAPAVLENEGKSDTIRARERKALCEARAYLDQRAEDEHMAALRTQVQRMKRRVDEGRARVAALEQQNEALRQHQAQQRLACAMQMQSPPAPTPRPVPQPLQNGHLWRLPARGPPGLPPFHLVPASLPLPQPHTRQAQPAAFPFRASGAAPRGPPAAAQTQSALRPSAPAFVAPHVGPAMSFGLPQRVTASRVLSMPAPADPQTSGSYSRAVLQMRIEQLEEQKRLLLGQRGIAARQRKRNVQAQPQPRRTTQTSPQDQAHSRTRLPAARLPEPPRQQLRRAAAEATATVQSQSAWRNQFSQHKYIL